MLQPVPLYLKTQQHWISAFHHYQPAMLDADCGLFVSLSLHLFVWVSVTWVIPSKTAEPIEMPFGAQTRMVQGIIYESTLGAI